MDGCRIALCIPQTKVRSSHRLLAADFYLCVLCSRFLVHRYSVLQQHAEANGFEGVDTVDASKAGYHDDSDEASDRGGFLCLGTVESSLSSIWHLV